MPLMLPAPSSPLSTTSPRWRSSPAASRTPLPASPTCVEEDGALLGYAYAHPYAARPAYQWSAELTVYLRQGAARRGLGSRLYGALFDLLRLQGVRTVYGCVTAENALSVAFHQALGFREAGRFAQVGYKHGRWLDVLWLEKPIAPAGEPQPLVPLPPGGRRGRRPGAPPLGGSSPLILPYTPVLPGFPIE